MARPLSDGERDILDEQAIDGFSAMDETPAAVSEHEYDHWNTLRYYEPECAAQICRERIPLVVVVYPPVEYYTHPLVETEAPKEALRSFEAFNLWMDEQLAIARRRDELIELFPNLSGSI